MKKKLAVSKAVEELSATQQLDVLRGAEHIRAGRVIGIPTETYYGLAADPQSVSAVAQLFTPKTRPPNKPILLLVGNMDQLDHYVASIPPQYLDYMDRYWPGPLTLVFPAREDVPERLTGGTGTIGIRLTPHPLARALIRLLGHPITATSANISSQDPARTAEEVRSYFGTGLGYVVDGGPADGGAGSTVITIQQHSVCIAREGRLHLPGLARCNDEVTR